MSTTDGFAAMGKSTPHYRRSAALEHVREMVQGISTQEAVAVIDRTANALERDDPYRAQRAALSTLDLTGAYRLMAVLLTDPATPEHP
jgi:uncharacterized protein YoaH (UPF0181 family)